MDFSVQQKEHPAQGAMGVNQETHILRASPQLSEGHIRPGTFVGIAWVE